MKTLARKIRSAVRLAREGGLKALATFALHRYKYPYLQLFLRLFPTKTPLRQPHVVQVEISSKCNLRCPSCSLTREAIPGRNMTLEEFVRLLDRLPFRPSTLSLNGIGEALVNRDLFSIIDVLRQRSIACSFYTNGTLLTEPTRRRILERENVVFVGISCDGASKEVFERLRLGAKFGPWKENVKAFVAAAKQRSPTPIQVNLNTVVSRDNKHELRQLAELASELGFGSLQLTDLVANDPISAGMALEPGEWEEIDREALIAYAATLGVTVNVGSMGKRPRPWINCFQPWEYIQISAEGDILPCCAILGSDKAQVMGNLHRESFSSVWGGERFRQFRSTAVRGTNAICNACPYY